MASARYPGRNVSSVKAHNTRAVLLNLLYNEPGYRATIARDISVSATTITKLVEELISQGIIVEIPEENTRRRSVGRPQNALYLVRDARKAIGIHIGGDIFRVAIVNLRNEIIDHRTGSFSLGSPVESVLFEISNTARELIQACEICGDAIIGVGVGAPGLVNYQTGVIGFAKNQGWRDVPVGEFLSNRLDLPVLVENNVRAMALGEAFFGIGKEASSLLFVYGRLGVGAGIVVDHRIHRGSRLGAGEIGHSVIFGPQVVEESPGEQITLEDLVSGPALVSKAREIGLKNPAWSIGSGFADNNDQDVLDILFEAVRQEDLIAKRMVESSIQTLGLTLVNAVNFINPELILIGGMFAQQQDIYLPVLREVVDRYSFADLGQRVRIEATGFGWRAGLLGASALALTQYFYLPA